MYILAFETTGPIGSVSLLDLETGEINMKSIDEPLSHLKNSAYLAEALLKETGLSGSRMSEIAAVAASIGPGSFTGIRIGVTMAKTFAMGLSIGAIAVPTLDSFKTRIGSKPISAILNARRGQVYGAVFNENGEEILEPGPYMLSDVLAVTDDMDEVIFYGDGVDAYRDILEESSSRILSGTSERYQDAGMVVKLAAEMYERGELVSPTGLSPNYMRLAEAEQKLKDGTLEEQRKKKWNLKISKK